MPPPEKQTQIANAISDADGDGQTGVTLYALSSILRMAGA